MFRIVRFPQRLEKYFRNLQDRFFWEHFEYFRMFVLLIAFAQGRRNVSALYRHLDPEEQTHRTRFNNFLSTCRWEPAKALATKAYELIESLGPMPGDVVDFIIDDSKKEKRGKKMDGVGWTYDPVTRRRIRGHQYVTVILCFRGFRIPFAMSLYVKEEECAELGIEFKTAIDMAAEQIRSFVAPKGVKVRVLFDSWYLCKKVVKACCDKGFYFISTPKKNRNLFKDGRKLKVGTYGRNVFRRRKKHIRTFRKTKTVQYQYLDCGTLGVGELGDLRVVFSRRPGDSDIRATVTNERALSARGMLEAYAGRWPIEVFFKESKQLLGLGQYQNASYEAAVTHLHLVCFAYALLTHLAIEAHGAQGKKRTRKTAVSRSVADLQNKLRRIVWDDLTKHLKALPTGNHVIKELGRLLVAA